MVMQIIFKLAQRKQLQGQAKECKCAWSRQCCGIKAALKSSSITDNFKILPLCCAVRRWQSFACFENSRRLPTQTLQFHHPLGDPRKRVVLRVETIKEQVLLKRMWSFLEEKFARSRVSNYFLHPKVSIHQPTILN